jgi:hypothetical protein
MKIPETKGRTILIKIAECALNGDKDMARKYVEKYMIIYPDSDLIYPFTHLLAGENNPSGLGHHDIVENQEVKSSNSDGNYSPMAKKVWGYLKYTECDINGEHKTLIEATEVWDMINALEFHIHDELMRLKNQINFHCEKCDDDIIISDNEFKRIEKFFDIK